MSVRSAVLLGVLALACALAPARTTAQEPVSSRVQDAIETTERRIEQAERVVTPTAELQAVSELGLARQLQSRARSAFNAAQYGLAERSTLEARSHADRAIAIVRGLPDPDRVQMQVERTAELAERARERLADCAETRARALLRVALEMQARAEAAVRESRHLAALQLTMSARERLFKAMRLCNVEESVSDNAAQALRRTDEIIARARDVLSEGDSSEAERALARAGSLQSEAQSEFRAQRYEAALRLTHTARLIARRAVRLGSSSGIEPGPRGRP